MEEKKFDNIAYMSFLDFERFQADYKRHFYLNVIGKFPNKTFLDYLTVLYQQAFVTLTEFYEIRNNIIESGKQFTSIDENTLESISQITRIAQFLEERIKFENGKLTEQEKLINKLSNVKEKKQPKLSNPKKLALLHELGIFELPIMKNLSDDKQNEIIGLLLDADKKEFVYKNQANINTLNSNKPYDITKYTAYTYLDDMRALLSEMK